MIKSALLVTIGIYSYMITRSKFYLLMPKLKSDIDCNRCKNYINGECSIKLELESLKDQGYDIDCSDTIIFMIDGHNGKLITEIIEKARENSITKCQSDDLIRAYINSFCKDSCPYNPDGCGTVRCQFDKLVKELNKQI